MLSALSSRNEVLEEVNFIRAGDIDSLKGNIFKVYRYNSTLTYCKLII